MSDNFCPAPWTSLYVDPKGTVTVCCVSKTILGNLNKNKLSEIVNNDQHKSIKKSFISNELPSGCSNCKIGPNNYKSVMVNKFKKYLPDESFYQSIDNFQLRLADIRFKNTCNYACVYCGPGLSSLWASIKDNSYIHIESESRDTLTEYILENAETLNDVMLAGGEPLLIKENEIILQKLLEVNPNVQIFVNTNLSQIRNNKIFNLLLQFKNVCWIVSVDDMGDKYNYIRWPGTWDNFYSNLLELQKISNHNVTFNMVYTVLNAKSIFDCIDKLESDGFDTFNIAYINGLEFNYWLDPSHLPDQTLTEIKDIIQNRIVSCKNDRLKNVYQTLLTKLEIKKTYKSMNNLFKRLKKLDMDRKLDSQHVFPELYKLLNTDYE